jgi:hypothetical protein
VLSYGCGGHLQQRPFSRCFTARAVEISVSKDEKWGAILAKAIQLPHTVVDACAVSAAPRKRHFYGQRLPQTELEGNHPTFAQFLLEREAADVTSARKWPESDHRLDDRPTDAEYHQNKNKYFGTKCATVTTRPKTERLKVLNTVLTDQYRVNIAATSSVAFMAFDTKCPGHSARQKSCKMCTQKQDMRAANFLWDSTGMLEQMPIEWKEALMGFPPGYTRHFPTEFVRCKAIGNAVHPDVIAHLVLPSVQSQLGARARVTKQIVVLSLFNGIDGFLLGTSRDPSRQSRCVVGC